MLPIVHIQKKQLIDKAVELVTASNKYLLVTMLLSKEESKNPPRYRTALSEALNRGISVERVCFGTKRDLSTFSKSFDVRVKVYLVKNRSAYQRLIISDGLEMLFKLGDQFYYSRNKLIVRIYEDYIRKLLT